MKIIVFKCTSDNWCPSYALAQGNKGIKHVPAQELVEVSLLPPRPDIEDDSGKWRVCAWGADDCGMERDFTDEQKAWRCFIDVLCLEDVTMETLKAFGFVTA